jgi:peptide-methionine (S)-S-oxide reductase
MRFLSKAPAMPTPAEVLPGRPDPMEIPERHYVSGARIAPPWPDGIRTAVFGLGCFWGAEKKFWETPGVVSTAVGYAGGSTPNPTYREVCTGLTGHAEVVRVVFDPARIAYERLLRAFWEAHDPTQGMRQGNDVGTQYRSLILAANDGERATAEASRAAYGERLRAAGYGAITTEVIDATAFPFHYAEAYHQQYLAKNRGSGAYCPDHRTGVKLPDDFVVTPLQYVD